jgi:hypothetical protein
VAGEPILALRELNRATLARQLLLEPGCLPVEDAVEAVGPLQAQHPPSPPLALWTRLRDFAAADLHAAMAAGHTVTALLNRGTLHVVSGREFPLYAAVAHAGRVVERRELSEVLGCDLELLHDEVLVHCASEARTLDEIAEFSRRWAAERVGTEALEAARSWRPVRGSALIVRAPLDGRWDRPAGYLAASRLLGELYLPPPAEALPELVRCHLRAFGPAAEADVAAWLGARQVTPVRAALGVLDEELVRFRDEAGRLLYDLERAPRPGADVEAPVRYLPAFDSLLLSHAPRFRTRVLPEAYRADVIRLVNAQVLATFLVDGTVAGTWSVDARRREAVLTLSPYSALQRRARAALVAEGERLVRFVAPEASAHAVRVGPA